MSETDEIPKAEPNPNHKRRSYSSDNHPDGAVVVKKSKTEGVFEIEADAAEDKGSRHTMEDAWVVLLNSTADSPSNLRFILHISLLSIYIVAILICVLLNLELNLAHSLSNLRTVFFELLIDPCSEALVISCSD